MGIVFDPGKLYNCPTCGNKPEVVAGNPGIIIFCCGIQSFTEASKVHNMYKGWNFTALGYVESEIIKGILLTMPDYKDIISRINENYNKFDLNCESGEKHLEPNLKNKTMEKIKKEIVTETRYSYKGVDYVYTYKVGDITLLCDLHMTQAVIINESDDVLLTIEIDDNQLIIDKK